MRGCSLTPRPYKAVRERQHTKLSNLALVLLDWPNWLEFTPSCGSQGETPHHSPLAIQGGQFANPYDKSYYGDGAARRKVSCLRAGVKWMESRPVVFWIATQLELVG